MPYNVIKMILIIFNPVYFKFDISLYAAWTWMFWLFVPQRYCVPALTFNRFTHSSFRTVCMKILIVLKGLWKANLLKVIFKRSIYFLNFKDNSRALPSLKKIVQSIHFWNVTMALSKFGIDIQVLVKNGFYR